jgi:hypothetical protein
MLFEFKNGSYIKQLTPQNTEENVRGLRSDFISCMCYDLETEQMVFLEDLDMRKPIDRYIPEWYLKVGDE